MAYSSLDEEIEQATAQKDEERTRREELEARAQQERMQRIEMQRRQQASQRQVAQNALKNAAKQQIKKQAKAAIGRLIITTAPYWGPPVLIILGIFLLVVVIFGSLVYACNESNAVKVASFATWAGSFGSVDICGPLKIANTGGLSGGAGATGAWQPTDLVTLVGVVPVDTAQASDPRVRQCMLARIQSLYSQSQAAGLEWRVTSAYRAGANTSTGGTSAHSRGEAVDIALVPPPTQPWSSNQQISSLISIARGIGFLPPAGDTLDEYNNQNEFTSGGHIHIEFNIPASGSYCDGTAS